MRSPTMPNRIHLGSGFEGSAALPSALLEFVDRLQKEHPKDAVWIRPHRNWHLLELVPITIVQQPLLVRTDTGHDIGLCMVIDVPGALSGKLPLVQLWS